MKAVADNAGRVLKAVADKVGGRKMWRWHIEGGGKTVVFTWVGLGWVG